MGRILLSSPRRRARSGWAVGGCCALVLAGALTGCAPGADPVESASPGASVTDAGTATAAPPVEPSTPQPPPAPTLVPGGTAQDNEAFFSSVVAGVWASPDRAAGRAYVDALAAAGFDKAAMQVTNDQSTVGDPAESLQFSVRWTDGQCLVGQVGPATGDPVVAVMPALGDGKCLLGVTRTIDW